MLVLGSLGNIGEDIDLAQGRLMESDVIAVHEGLGFLASRHHVARLYLIFLDQLFEP